MDGDKGLPASLHHHQTMQRFNLPLHSCQCGSVEHWTGGATESEGGLSFVTDPT